MQGTSVWSLVQEDPTGHGTTKPMNHNYWSPSPRARALQQEKPPQWEAHTPQLESSPHSLQLEKAQAAMGEGNGTPLQYSCLENPMDGGAW